MTDREPEAVALRLEWHVPEDMACQYATNLVVQQSEHEFIISFFNAPPPILIGSPEEIRDQLQQLGSVRADCVARIIVASSRMPEFVQVLQDGLKKYLSRPQETE